jgi:signal transduction histidine kinase
MTDSTSEFRRAVVRAAVMPISALALLCALLSALVIYTQLATGAVGRADVVIGRMNRVERLAVDRETGFRGYLLTGDERFLEPLLAADGLLDRSIDELRSLVVDPGQLARIEKLRGQLAAWREHAEAQIARRRAGAPLAELAAREVTGKARMDAVRALAGELLGAEESLRAARVERARGVTRVTLSMAVALTLVFGIALAVSSARALRRVGRVFSDAVRTRDEFISVAAHELKNPLTAFRLQVEALSRALRRPGVEVTRERITRGVTAMEQSAARFVELVNRLLDVSRVSTGQLHLEVTDVDLPRLVEECIERMRADIERAGSPVQIRAAPTVGRWDRLRVESVVTNLLSNALKYGLGRPIEIAVEEAAGQVRLVVRDHGIGISLEDQARIFARYERAVPPESYEGLGIGLWLTRAIVQAHGGTIAVESRPGAGAAFTVTLPAEVPPPRGLDRLRQRRPRGRFRFGASKADPRGGIGPSARVARHHLQEVVEPERLPDGVLHVAREMLRRRHGAHGDLRQRRLALPLAQELPAVHHRHHQVEQDEARLLGRAT